MTEIDQAYRSHQLNKQRAITQYVSNTVDKQGLIYGYVVGPILEHNRVLDRYNVYIPDKFITVENVPRLLGDSSGAANGVGNKPFPLREGQTVAMQYIENSRRPVIVGSTWLTGNGDELIDQGKYYEPFNREDQPSVYYPPYNFSSNLFEGDVSLAVTPFIESGQNSPFDTSLGNVASEAPGNFKLVSSKGSTVEGFVGSQTMYSVNTVRQHSGVKKTTEQKVKERLRSSNKDIALKLKSVGTLYLVKDGRLTPTVTIKSGNTKVTLRLSGLLNRIIRNHTANTLLMNAYLAWRLAQNVIKKVRWLISLIKNFKKIKFNIASLVRIGTNLLIGYVNSRPDWGAIRRILPWGLLIAKFILDPFSTKLLSFNVGFLKIIGEFLDFLDLFPDRSFTILDSRIGAIKVDFATGNISLVILGGDEKKEAAKKTHIVNFASRSLTVETTNSNGIFNDIANFAKGLFGQEEDSEEKAATHLDEKFSSVFAEPLSREELTNNIQLSFNNIPDDVQPYLCRRIVDEEQLESIVNTKQDIDFLNKLTLARLLSEQGFEYSGFLINNLYLYFYNNDVVALFRVIFAMTWGTQDAYLALVLLLTVSENPREECTNIFRIYKIDGFYTVFLDMCDILNQSENRFKALQVYLLDRGINFNNLSDVNISNVLQDPSTLFDVFDLVTPTWLPLLVKKDYLYFFYDLFEQVLHSHFDLNASLESTVTNLTQRIF